MSDRSFFTCKGYEFIEPGFANRAISELTSHHVGLFSLEETQLFAWKQELLILKTVAEAFPECTIAFEYMIPRMGRRVDAMLLIADFIFVVEFKVGEDTYPSVAISQVADYAFDLKSFHGGSHDRALFPILVCTDAPDDFVEPHYVFDGIYCVQRANANNLLDVLAGTMQSVELEPKPLDHKEIGRAHV